MLEKLKIGKMVKTEKTEVKCVIFASAGQRCFQTHKY